MYNIGVVITREQNDEPYTSYLNKTNYKLYSLSGEQVLHEASKMDALIVEESSVTELKHTCELVLELRRRYEALIWVVCKNLNKTSKLIYLQLGADGVVDGEHEQEESFLQFSNLLNRIKSENYKKNSDISYEREDEKDYELELNPANLSVILDRKREVSLTRLEFQALSFLFTNIRRAITYEEIYRNVWKDDFNNEHIGNKQYRVSNLIFHLRKKIEKNPNEPSFIKTVRSKGYMLVL